MLQREWVIAHDGWNGDCATWQHTYEVPLDDSPGDTVMNGTGPYTLEVWDPKHYIILAANPSYWRTEEIGPAWEGGHAGTATVERVGVDIVSDAQGRINRMLAGEADFAVIALHGYDDLQQIIRKTCPYNFATGDTPCHETGTKYGYLTVYANLPHWEFDHSPRGYTIQSERYYLYIWNYDYYYNPATAYPYFYALVKTRH